MTVSAAPGWYGKLPVLGDFASRRLPPGFVTAWDRWLQQGMTQLGQQLGTSWLDAYMTAPVWRFVLGAQTLDEHPWAGVMLPSVDRVGRYFPLTVCAGIPGIAAADDVATVERWLGDIETAARAGLNADISLDAFDAALAACIVPAAWSCPKRAVRRWHRCSWGDHLSSISMPGPTADCRRSFRRQAPCLPRN